MGSRSSAVGLALAPALLAPMNNGLSAALAARAVVNIWYCPGYVCDTQLAYHFAPLSKPD